MNMWYLKKYPLEPAPHSVDLEDVLFTAAGGIAAVWLYSLMVL